MSAADTCPHVDWITCEDGQRLYCWWRSGAGSPRGVVWYVLGPECGALPPYPQLSETLVDAGFGITLMHPRGTGYSPGRRGDTGDYRRVLGDYRRFRVEIERRQPGVPLFLIGHSVGAAFAAEVAAAGDHPVSGLVLVNPAYRLRATKGMTPTWRQYATYAVSALMCPRARVVDMNGDPSAIAFGPDRDEACAMQHDPHVVRHFSVRMLRAQQRVMDRLPSNLRMLEVPVLVVQGAHDALVDPSGNDELLTVARSPGATKLVAPLGGHGSSAVETAVEPIVRWLQAHVAPAQAAA